MTPLRQAVLTVARGQLGVREHGGRNRGPEVEAFQAAAGARPGDAWCASFVVWTFEQAAIKLGIKSPVPRTPGVRKLWDRSKPYQRLSDPRPGDVFVSFHDHGLGHCGIVEAVSGDDLKTIEGNTNPGGSREGDGVYQRVRGRHEIQGFLSFDMNGAIPESIAEAPTGPIRIA